MDWRHLAIEIDSLDCDRVHESILGQIHRKVKDLPEGTMVGQVTVDGKSVSGGAEACRTRLPCEDPTMSTIVREEPTTQAPAAPPVRVAGRAVYRLTAAQVLRMIDAGIVTSHTNAELIDGVLYEMTKGELHNAIVNVAGDLLRPLVALAPERHHVRLESSNTADPYSLPEPDVSVVAGGVFDYVPTPPPLMKLGLVVEVDNSRSSDDTDKLAKYARAAIPTYWMIDAPGRVVVVYTQPNANDGYDRREIRRPGDTLDVVIGGHACGTVRVADLFPPATTD